MSAGRAGAVLAAAAATAYLAGLAFDVAWLRLVTKPVPVLCLAGWVASRPSRSGWLVAGGLLLSALGDVLLETPDLFLAGLSAFLLAHVAYTAAFALLERRLRALRALPFAAYGLGLFAWLRPGLGELARPVAAYVVAICAMLWRAAALPGGARSRVAWPALGGALLFAASDTLIGLDRFRAPIPGVRYPIILLYWLGQTGLALSVRGEAKA